MRPIVAIVGRPNVGKSTLFNRLAGRSVAIVHDSEGVTRDRHYVDTHVHGRDFALVDTGGFDPNADDPLQQGIARGVDAAIAEAEVIICVLDATTGPTEGDRLTVERLRRSARPVVYVANKADGAEGAMDAAALYTLGLERLIAVSALHGRGMHELEAAVVGHLPPPVESTSPEAVDALPRIALLGRPNAGKSSLFNRLVGTERSVVDARPGTTADPVDVRVELMGTPLLLVDTAGIRRKTKVEGGVETASVLRAMRTMERADVVLLLADATQGIAEQDARLLGLAQAKGRGIVVGLNKTDLLDAGERKRAIDEARVSLHFAPWASIVPLSAKSGAGIGKLTREILATQHAFHLRVPTAELNRFFREVLAEQPPPTQGGRAPRLYYVTQAETAPPVFVVMCSSPAHVRDSYQRFVQNQLRRTFAFHGVPLIVHFRRSRRDRTE
jgi:GTPase